MEFDWIRQHFQPLSLPARPQTVLNNGDDAAIWQAPAGLREVLSVDMACAGVHFPAQADAAAIGYRSLACAVSDLAAMGAEPSYATLALSLPPGTSSAWLSGLAQGIAEGLEQYGMQLIGGDTTSGASLVLSISVHGWVGQRYFARQRAKAGDLIAVTGPTGLAAAALPWLEHPKPPAAVAPLLQAYWRPQPQLALAAKLIPWCQAAIDISDGLLADLNHMAQASKLGYRLQADALPLTALLAAGLSSEQSLQAALTGGDDYQLLLAIPPAHWPEAQALGLILLGEFTADQDRQVIDQGQPLSYTSTGYQHHDST